MAKASIVLFLIVVGSLINVFGRSVDKRLLASDPSYLHNIEVKMQDMTQTIADLTQKYGDMAQKYLDLDHANKDMAAKLMQQNKTIEALQKKQGNQSNIYFDAYLTKDVGNLGLGQTIVFDGIKNNVGNRYNPATGQFICDKPGVYVFYCRVLVVSGIPITLAIVKNGLSIEMMYANDPDTWSHSATMIVHHLQIGDVVWVKAHESQSHSLTGDILDDIYTTFAGFLLHSDL